MIAGKIAQVTDAMFEHKYISIFNNVAKYLMESRGLALHTRKLDLKSLHVRAFADASFATNHDHTSQVGHIAMPCDK